jgi:hypothetical protein
VLELPACVFEDAAAMYRSATHHRRTVNGMSGYEPPHYSVLCAALAEGSCDVLAEFAAYADLAVFVRRDDGGASLTSSLTTQTMARPIGVTDRHDVFLLPRSAGRRPLAPAGLPTVRAWQFTSEINGRDLNLMNDDDPATAWIAGESQDGREQFVVDLGETVHARGVIVGLGGRSAAFPRVLAVDASVDGTEWTEVWHGATAAMTLATAIEDPRAIAVPFMFAPREARYIRVRQTGHAERPWAVAEFRVVVGEFQPQG